MMVSRQDDGQDGGLPGSEDDCLPVGQDDGFPGVRMTVFQRLPGGGRDGRWAGRRTSPREGSPRGC